MIIDQYNAVLMLSDGRFFLGRRIGATGTVVGECCFTTAMTGYQESITDSSYHSQVLVFAASHIGNTGFNQADYEKNVPGLQGVVLSRPITNASNHRSCGNFNTWLLDNEVVGICDVDTRAVVKHVVNKGGESCVIAPYDENCDLHALHEYIKNIPMLSCEDLTSKVVCNGFFDWHEEMLGFSQRQPIGLKIAVIDFGVKFNMLRILYSRGCDVRVFPYNTSLEQIMEYNPSGILLSNGPGNPIKFFDAFKDKIKFFLEKDIPLFGICFGHQLLALALGASVYHMHHGHRSITHPVLDKLKNHIYITTQNHGFAVDRKSLNENIIVTHESLLDGCIEGIAAKNYKAFSVQYHPECSPGPNDSVHFFDDFINIIKTTTAK